MLFDNLQFIGKAQRTKNRSLLGSRRERKIGIYGGKLFMKKFRTVASVIIMVIAGIVGFFIGAFLNEPMAGTILFSMIAGIACIVYAIDNHEE